MQAAASRASALLGTPAASSFTRGATALYALLQAIARRDGAGEVVIPSICCEVVVLAARYAGHIVRFADVSPETLCLTPATAVAAMTPRTRAVLVVHAFGADAGAEDFLPLRAAHPRAVFIEDIAQSLGGLNRNGCLLGAELDCALLSFAAGKIAAGDGGMLLYTTGTRCPAPADVEAAVSSDAPRLPQDALALKLRNLAHAFGAQWRARPEARPAPVLGGPVDEFRDLVICSGSLADDVAALQSLERLEQERNRRYARYTKYRDGISAQGVRMVGGIHKGCTCWRASVLFEEPAAARRTTAALRARGIHASNHYVPLHLLFGGPPLPDAEATGARIVNLWVDDSAPESMVDGAIAVINGKT